jgi:ribose transport system ATP-binding protein
VNTTGSSRVGGSGPLLRTVGISKSYSGNRVLADVSFRLTSGESVAVIGENGAGKSTFAKVLAGAIRPDGGTLEVGGEPVSFHSPRDALRHGIAFIPQELAYVPHMTVAENILLGHWPGWHGLTSPGSTVRDAQRECERYGILLDVRRVMTTLKLADRQIVEIIKALARKAQVIVLDEPTASLSEQESRALFAVLKRLTDAEVGVIYISHRMDEVYEFSDRVVVFRNGELVASVAPAESTPAQLIAYMLGQEKEKFVQSARRVARDKAVVELREWTHDGVPSLSHVSLSVARGEIVGLYGLRGSGADLVAEGLAGLRPEIRGELSLNRAPRPIFATPLAAYQAKVAYVPPERKRDGLVLILSIQSNLVLLILQRLSRWGVVRRRQEATTAQELAARFDVRYRTLGQPLGQLSGGNQQKVLLASRMAASPQLLILQEPTRGVDVGARVEIHRFLVDIARQGCAVLLVTSDVEESVIVSDRLIVLRDGAIVGELSGSSKTQASAIALSTGKAA